MTPSELELQLELSHHARGLRAMARDLLRDEHAAEDVVQEAALCTLRARPAEPGSLGGWLVTVLRNLCFQHRRREQRRQLREQAASRSEHLPAAAEMAERRETLRRVTDAVLGLREPYQGALLLRYFEGLSPRQIARRTDTSVATVKSRLQRGLGLLRAQMDASADRRRNRDDWRSTLAAAVGLPTGLATTTTTLLATGITLMGPAAKLGLVAAAVVASTALVWTFSGTAAVEPVSPVAAHDEAPAVAPDTAADQARAPLEPPEAVSELHSPTDSPLHHPFSFDLQVDVVDRDGLPVADAQVQVAPPGCSLTAWPERTGADGTVHVRFRGRQPGMELSVSTDGLRGQRRVQVQSTEPARVVLLAELPGARYTMRSRAVLSYTLKGEHLVATSGEKLVTTTARASLHPDAVFADQSAAAPGAATRSKLSEVELKLEGRKVTLGTAMVKGLTVEGAPRTVAEQFARITGTVCGEDGRPVPRCTVVWGKSADRPLGRTVTDDQGAFTFAKVPPGAIKLRAGGGDGGLCRRDVLAVAGETWRWDACLERGTCLVGRALDQDGKPLAGWSVEFVGAAWPWADDCTVREDGTFELPNHPGGLGSVLLWSKDRNARLPLLALHSVRPDDGPVLLRLDSRAASGQLELETPVPDGVPVSPVVRVWQEDTGRGCAMQQAAGGRHKLGQLPAGWYRVGIEGGVLGWLDAGRHWVNGHHAVQLGRVHQPAPGRLRIHRSKPTAEVNPQRPPLEQVCLRRPECDLRTFEDGRLESDVRLLAAGDYWFLWRDGAGVTRYQPFTIQSGGEALVIWRDDAPALGK